MKSLILISAMWISASAQTPPVVAPVNGGAAQAAPTGARPVTSTMDNINKLPSGQPVPPPQGPVYPIGGPTYNCAPTDIQCLRHLQQAFGAGCPPGPQQAQCFQQKAQQMQMQQQQQNDFMKVLNQMQGGGQNGAGSNTPQPGYERMAGTEGDYGHGYSPGGYVSGNPTASSSQLIAHSNRGFAPIVDPFKAAFPRCTEKAGLGTCQYVPLGIWGDKAHAVRQSCHNAGEAIDVGLPFQCSNGGRIDARDPRIYTVVRCFANDFPKPDGKNVFGVIYQDINEGPNWFSGSPPGAHNGHMHIQLRNCNKVYGW